MVRFIADSSKRGGNWGRSELYGEMLSSVYIMRWREIVTAIESIAAPQCVAGGQLWAILLLNIKKRTTPGHVSPWT